MKYEKPPLTFSDQLNLLKSRGLIVEDETKAKRYLSNISYYRLSAYMLPLQDNSKHEHSFHRDSTFEKILNLYVFDRQLRLLVFDSIERLEIAFRTQLIYHFSISFGSHWFLDSRLFRDQSWHNKLLEYISDQSKNYNKEIFIKHYAQKYSDPYLPPSWMHRTTFNGSAFKNVQ